MRNARFRQDPGPIEAACPCPVCTRYSRAYLRHLVKSNELLAHRLLTHHNIWFYGALTRAARDAMTPDTFDASWRAGADLDLNEFLQLLADRG